MLPFYPELPVEVHTHLLTQRWAELVLLSACYYATSVSSSANDDVSTTIVDEHEEVSNLKISVLESYRRLNQRSARRFENFRNQTKQGFRLRNSSKIGVSISFRFQNNISQGLEFVSF